MMKKTILSLAVSMASFGAFAATDIATDAVEQGVDNIEIFGKIGVSYDKDSEADSSDVDYLRNTEIGIRTGAELSHGMTATAEVIGNFNNTDKQLGLDKLELGVSHKQGAIHFGKIEDRYDASTVKFDQFGDTFAGLGEIEGYNATGKANGIALSATPVENLELTVQVDDGNGLIGDIGDAVSATATYSVAGVDLAAGYKQVDEDSFIFSEQDSKAYKLGAGYGISNFYAGVIYEASEDQHKVEVDTVALTASYEINALTLKAGYTDTNETDMGVKEGTSLVRLGAEYALRDNVALNAGYAKVKADSVSSEDLITAGMIVRF